MPARALRIPSSYIVTMPSLIASARSSVDVACRMTWLRNGDLWVALWNAGKLMKIDYKTKEMTVFTPPSQTGGNYSVIVDKKNNYIWVSEHQVDKVARFDPKTQEWVEFPLPEAESDPRRLDIDPTNPNRIFFAGNTPGRMGFVEILP